MNKVIFLVFALMLCATGANAQDDSSIWYEQYEIISYSELRALINDDMLEEARVLHDGWWVTVKTKDGTYFDTRVTPQTPIVDHFFAAGVPVSIEHGNDEEEEDDELPLWLSLFFNILPLLIFLGFFFVMMRVISSKKKEDKFFARLEETIKRSMNNG